MQDKAGQVPQHGEEVRILSPRFFFSITNLLLLFGVCFHQVFEKLRRVFTHIDTRACAAIAAVAARRGIDHGLLAALRIARFRVKTRRREPASVSSGKIIVSSPRKV
jgi:hypothetical protein